MKNLVFVFALLLTLVCCTTEADRDRMHAGLDSINQRNRNDQPFTVADVEPYVRFFDDHGTPNDRLLAYYLLGRAYHDHGEGMLSILGYDKMGFVAKKSEIGLGRQMSISDYINNTLGEVTQENFRKYKPTTNGTMECIASGTIQNNYIYLHTNLLTSSVISITDKNGSMRTDTIQNLTYDNFGHVMTNDRGGTVADMTYGYDLMHGWLKSIRSGGRFEQNLYRESEGSTPCFNGNISAMTWRTGNDYVRRFDYEYNEMNWLSQATFSYYSIGNPNSPSPTLSLIPYVGLDHEDYTSEYSYDKNGNLTAAYRQGLVGDLYDEDEYCVYDTMDDYNVEYYGNQRRSVNGSGPGTPSYYGSSSFVDGVEDGDDEYAYNANGAMTMDLNKGITNISYDLLNNIRQVTFSGNRNIVYTYAADGTRLRAVHSRKVGNTWLKDSTDYCGSLILQNGAPSMYQFAGGYISFSNSALSGCHYYIQDYLGNNRMVVNKTDAVEQTTHYYPYGGVIGGIALNPGFQKYKFGGKELDRSYGLDWYDVQARQYDPVVPSWHTIDPLAEKYYCISPYAYCVNNPVMYFDPDGKWSWDSNGNLVAQKGDDVNTMANYLGTSSSNALQILDRCGIKANSEGILNLSAGQILNKTNLWVGTKSKNGSVVNNTAEAIAHYYLGNGKAADVGDQSTKELLSSEKFQSELNTITTTKVKSKGSFSVDMTDKTFHIGRTIVDYKITSNGTSNSVTFTLFANDGFWDPDFIDEKNLGEKFGIPFFQPDGMGPNLERGGTPYPYKTRSRTFFFKPTE